MAFRFKVTTTKGIAGEMCRYDNARVESAEFKRFGILRPITDLDQALKRCKELGLDPDSRLVYEWTIRSPYAPTTARWESFGVKVRELERVA